MRKEKRDNLLGRVFYVLTLGVVFGSVTFMGYERRDPEEDLKLIKTGDLVMCTAEKASGDKTRLHIVEAVSVMENVVEDRELRGWILNNDAIVSGITKYEDFKNCEGEIIFAEAGSEKERDLRNGITTKGLPYEITYSSLFPTQSF